MRLQTTLKYLSVVMVLVLTAMLYQQVASRAEKATVDEHRAVGSNPSNDDQETYTSRLAPGIIGSAPTLNEVPAVTEIPWLSSNLMQAYNDAVAASCQMLLPGQTVQPPLHLLSTSESIAGGRIAALTIRLDVDEREKSKLPTSTKGTILRYLRDHEIVLEPTIHHDPDGRLYFGGDCRAAFYEVSRPEVTVQSEPMVQEAIGRIRTLGVLGDQGTNNARTLVLAIRYARTTDQIAARAGGAKFETELLFFHLPADATLDSPRLTVFASSDGRENLHRLDRLLRGQANGTALLTATIRFDSFVMMGVYPASPVVTGIQPHRSVQLPVDALLRLTSATSNRPQRGFQSVLDQFSVSDDVSKLVAALSQSSSTN